MKTVLFAGALALFPLLAAAFPLPGGISPDGRYAVSLEDAAPLPGPPPDPGGQVLAIAQPGAPPLTTPVDTGHLEGPVSPGDRAKVEWSPAGSFFVFSFQRANRLLGEIVSVNTGVAGATGTAGGVRAAFFRDVAGGNQIVSYRFLGPDRIRIDAVTPVGQSGAGAAVQYTVTVLPDGSIRADEVRPQ